MQQIHTHLCEASSGYRRRHQGHSRGAIHGLVLVFFGYAILAMLMGSVGGSTLAYGDEVLVRDVMPQSAALQGRIGALGSVPIEIEYGLADVTDNPMWFLLGHMLAVWNIY